MAPGADPWQPGLTATTAGPPGFSGSAVSPGVGVAPLKPPHPNDVEQLAKIRRRRGQLAWLVEEL